MARGCQQHRLVLRSFRRELRFLSRFSEEESSEELGLGLGLPRRRSCDLEASREPGRRLPRNATSALEVGAAGCAAGRIAELVLCSQARLLRRDPVGVLRHLETANSLIPDAGSCLPGMDDLLGSADEGGGFLIREEVFDNLRNAVRAVGKYASPDEEESEGFFTKPLTEDAWKDRVAERMDEEMLSALRWRSHGSSGSAAAKFARRPAFSEAAPSEGRADRTEDEPCGLEPMQAAEKSHPSQAPRSRRSAESSARQLSQSGCVWLLENACIEERKIVLFATGADARALPKSLLGCGEFGNYDFTAVEVRHPRFRYLQFPSNATEQAETLLIIPGSMSGVSAHNPFHLLHSTVPAAWQLHHPEYGLCVPRTELDIRFAYISAFHGRRQSHFWNVFTREQGVVSADSEAQRLSIAAQWRFWWSPLSEAPPIPLGSDTQPRCYKRMIFGRELFRTGIGGFVTPRAMAFYHRYLAAVMPGSPRDRPLLSESEAEARLFSQLRPGAPRMLNRDAVALWELGPGGRYDAAFFTKAGALKLQQRPFNLQQVRQKDDVEEASQEPRMQLLLSGDPGSAKTVVHVLWVQRPKRARRWIANMEEVAEWIQGWRHPGHPGLQVAVLVADFEQLHPATQWRLAAQADILVGVTGAALAWAAFQRPGAAVLDIFPPGSNFCTEGWGKNYVSHYGGLARLSGVQHTCTEHPAELEGSLAKAKINSPDDAKALARKQVREQLGGFWHGQNLRLDMPKMRKAFMEAVDRVLPLVLRGKDKV
ncbi:unnamed protein product [Polarella glacialis]|uniref:Glycosyltransferase 61 catalytic domain-containing protein n=1 Tax=Polarella glacialis TaxID=89957 RepID=A0A813I3A2_POLGL|nr:unnamed protein product [Polarella glacialis]